MGEDHAVLSPDWESGIHWDMVVASAHSIFQQKGATVWAPPVLVAAAVQRQRDCGLNYYRYIMVLALYIHTVSSGAVNSESAASS